MQIHQSIKLLLFCLVAVQAAGQEKIESDRPGETQAAGVVEKGYFQVEAGLGKEQQNRQDKRYQHPQAYLKYGLSKKFELRAEVSGETQQYQSTADYRSGLQPVKLGFKARLAEEKGALPAATFYTQVGLPRLAADGHKVPHVFPELRLLFRNGLTEKLKLEYNLGAEWDGASTHPQWLYTVAPELELGEKWEAFVEAFGYFHQGAQPQHHFDGGLAFYPARHLKLDVAGGWGLSREAPAYFLSGGLSFRFRP